MSVVLRFLGRSKLPIFLVMLLLMTKVATDLFLPLFTSQIVNVGIQQGGLETALPLALTADTFEQLVSESDATTRSLLLSSYAPDTDTYAERSYALQREAVLTEAQMIQVLAPQAFASQSLAKQASLARIRTEYERLGIDVHAIQSRFIARTGLFMIGISALGMAASIIVSFLASRIAAALGRDIRSALFKKTVSFNQDEIDRFSTASLVTRSTNDIQQIQQSFVMILRVVVFAPLMALGGLFRVLRTNSSMSWTIGVAIIAISTVVLLMFTLAMPRFKRMQLLVDSVNRIVRETLNGLQVIRAFNTLAHERKRFEQANAELTATSLFLNRAMGAMMPLMMLIMNLTAILIVSQGGRYIAGGTMQVGDMMAFIQYAMLIIMSFLMMTMLTIMIPRAAVSAGRIKEVLDTPPTVVSPPDPIPLPVRPNGTVVFDHVSYAYPGAEAEALSDISFVAHEGTVTAIIGSTGSGKSTLLNLILRFHDVSAGSISIDGIDIRRMDTSQLRKMIGYVPQRGLLFSGTVESNIVFGDREADADAIRQAAEIAQARQFIEDRPGQYGSPIAQGGTNVSGGQRQRLSIARAIASSPKILLFDDSFSALDYRTELHLRSALHAYLQDATIFIVAQRISSILHADTILVLDEGKLVDKGTHKELMQRCPVYQQIAYSQLSMQEISDHE